MTRKYRVIIKQAIEFKIFNSSTRTKDKGVIKQRLKEDPPFVSVFGGESQMETLDKVTILNVKKIANYEDCPKCNGKGETEKEYWTSDSWNDTNCSRCNGTGEIIKRRKQNAK